MPGIRRPVISSRKLPKQARSTDLVAAILEAALQVLAKDGAAQFTTARVAEKAGVSVGSIYQYFPNKAAILFQLQADEWKRTTGLLKQILQDRATAPLDRLRMFVHAFIRSECEEAQVRAALSDSAPLYREAPEAHQARSSADKTFASFIEEALPKASSTTRAQASELLLTTLSSVGSSFSAEPRSMSEIESYSAAMADMFSAYLKSL